MKTMMYAYKMGSQGAKALAGAMGIKRILHNGTAKLNVDVLINWGSGSLPARVNAKRVLNNPEAVTLSANKLKAFVAMKDTGCTVDYTSSKEIALRWIEEGSTVVCRTILNGHSGNGIIIAEKADELVDAPLYTKYFNKKEEYRVHVFNGEMLYAQRKARKREVPDDKVNWKVRNHDNGFIFQLNGFVLPEVCKDVAIKAVKALGLDFGAVDVGYTNGVAKVFEVNTAPGLTGTSIELYKDAVNNFIGG